MTSVVAIVEGYGDVQAIPSLLAKTGALLGANLVVSKPIRSGEWKSLRIPGELEKYLELAYRRGCDHILVILDLEDDCPASEHASAVVRVNKWVNGRSINVSVVFMVREYESIFLDRIADIVAGAQPIPNPESYRDAKGKLKQVTGRRYKETQDQEAYTKAIDLSQLVRTSRSFRKLVKELSGMTYAQIDQAFP